MPDVNIPLLRKCVEWAEAEAMKLDQRESQWEQGAWVRMAEDIGRNCGTCYCIAGYVTLMGEGIERDEVGIFGFRDVSGKTIFPCKYAQESLGLSDRQTGQLFRAANTIEDVRRIAEEIAGERL